MSSAMTFMRICANCNKKFVARTSVTKSCSDNCAKQLYKKRQREKKKQVSDTETAKVITVSVELLQAKAFLSVEDAHQLLGVSRSTLVRMLQNGQLPYAKFGRRTLINRSDINQLFKPAEGGIKLNQQ